MSDFLTTLSPIELVDGVYLKRNDKLTIYDVNGGKAQGAYYLIQEAKRLGKKGVVSCGSRHSPQCKLVGKISYYEGVDCHLFLPIGPETDTIVEVSKLSNCTLHRLNKGYTSQIIKGARDFSILNDYYLIPFGMKCKENINIIAKQCANIPNTIKRVVVPIGSGVTFCGVLKGVHDYKLNCEVIGVQTGALSEDFINQNKPILNSVKYKIYTFEPNLIPKDRYATMVDASIGDVKLNPIYEAKCREFIQPGDLFWIVAK